MRIKPFLHLRKWFAPFVKGALLILLFFAVPTLSTLAKDSWYLPQSNPGHYLNIATKMQVRHCPVILEKAPVQAFVNFVFPRPVRRNTLHRNAEPPKPSIGVTVSQQ